MAARHLIRQFCTRFYARCMGLTFCALLTAFPLAPAYSQSAQDRPLLVFAAASLSDALDAVLETSDVAVRVSYAASSTLARQIERGAPADLYIAANVDWMDYLAAKGTLRAGSRRDLLGNAIVLIAPKAADGGQGPAMMGADFPLVAMLDGGRLALGDPDHVPAGIYARQALTTFGLWPAVAPHVARATNVRAALALVARGEAPLGIVYKSDALADPSVTIRAHLPAGSHAPIRYPMAVTDFSDAPARASRLADYLAGPRAAKIFAEYGFAPLTPDTPS
jgi:molybdate transport system substrate-binding protein